MAQAPIGHRIRTRRAELGYTQMALAKRAGISPSYLNLIEHDRRSAGRGLLRRLADALDVDVNDLSGAEESHLLAELGEAAGDPLFADAPLGTGETERLVASAPQAARALLTLYRAYRDMKRQVDELSERLNQDPFLAEASHQILTQITSIRSFSEILQDYGDLEPAQRERFLSAMVAESERLTRVAQEMFAFLGGQDAQSPMPAPEAEVDDFIADNRNHFPELERAGAELRRALARGDRVAASSLQDRLAERHRVSVAFAPPDELPARGQVFDTNARKLWLSEGLPETSVRFRLAELVAALEAASAVDALLVGGRLRTPATREAARRALLRYLAGAVLLPYDPFLEAAEALRYDIERLQQRFAASFEQVCHRLTTLGRDHQQGIPFHFVRSDIAGNLSKRFSTSGLRLPRHSGACPRWVLHEAFLAPGRIHTQLAEMPDGSNYVFIAQAVAKAVGGYGQPRSRYAVMIGCDAAYARRLVYADQLTLAAGTPVGMSCRQCPREDCGQRAFPAAIAPGGSPVAGSAGEGAAAREVASVKGDNRGERR